MNYAGVLAGGVGSRMESSLPKQFLKINNIPIIIRIINTFLKAECIDVIVVAINPQWDEYFLELLKEYNIDASQIITIHGGKSRFESTANIAKKCHELSNKDEKAFLLVHDCARLFVSQRIIKDNFDLVSQFDMVTTAMPTIDTVILAENCLESTIVPRRDTVFMDQGPQTFRINQFINILNSIPPEKTEHYIEAGAMYLDHKLRVGIVPGERANFKVTTNFDIILAECMINEKIVE